MVRNIAGTLLMVGSGERPTEWAAEVLAARDRTRGGITAPAGGLYLLPDAIPEPCRSPSPTGRPWLCSRAVRGMT